MNARPPDVNVDAPIGQPVRSVPSSTDSAWISCSLIALVPIAPDRYIVRVPASITGVPRMPSG